MSEIKDKDWEEFLASEPEKTEATFPLTPDESVENPQAHVKPVNFFKTPAFLWMTVTGGFVFLVLILYGVSAYISNTRKAVAIAPQKEDVFAEPSQSKEFLPKAPQESGLVPVPTPPARVASAKSSVSKFPPRRTVPFRYRRSYVPADPTQERVARQIPVRQVEIARTSAPKAQIFHPPAKPKELPETIGALYAPDSGEGPQLNDTQPIASASNIDNALAVYDGTQGTPIEESSKIQKVTKVQQVTKVEQVARVEDKEPQPLTSEEFQQKFPKKAAEENLIAQLAIIPAESRIKGQTLSMLSWATQESFPIGEEIRIQVRSNFKQDGKVIIPKGSIAIAQSQKGTMGQYIMADVTRIETPSGQSYSIAPGMLTASNRDGFISAELKEPHRGGGAGGIGRKFLQSAISIGAASFAPQGDRFSDRLAQRAIYVGADTATSALDGDDDRRGGRGQIPSMYLVKPKTHISLIANGDIQLQEGSSQLPTANRETDVTGAWGDNP